MTLRGALRTVLFGAGLAGALSGCSGTTLDSLGTDKTGEETPSSLRPVSHSPEYVNVFGTLLGKSDDAIDGKITSAFQQLFHGTLDQSIFRVDQDGSGRSSIVDFLHNDVRSEGLGLAMLITVELNKKQEFDELWLFTKYAPHKKLFVSSGAAAGYFSSNCGEDAVEHCYDVYGMQLFALSLMFAHARWHSTADMPYESDALALLDVLKNKEAENGGVVAGIGSAFSAESFLVREDPQLADAGFTTRSSLQMPAFYWYWGEATGMPFWSSVEKASRTLLLKAADSTTGLWPMRSYFDATTVAGSLGYTQQGYRTQLNLGIDALWGTASRDQAEVAGRLANFFGSSISQGVAYGGTFETDGTAMDMNPARALISVNGTLAVSAPSSIYRNALAEAVWDQPIPTGDNRYYEGLMYLMSMLILSGQMQVY
ncbi:MAG TPA: glycosyl hydrolase family 8 [Polyangiaceae bacterium]|jgi:oligosaccharide reducing-end xylanase|nr:glycosyl hydrolase family 8 [Polyangiaceae bacterium]